MLYAGVGTIERQYDEMVKHAIAMHRGIADAEAILRRKITAG